MDDRDGYFGESVAARYDDPSDPRFQAVAIDPAVDLLAELAGSGRALELAIGTGRIAVPLSRRGVPLSGIELSRAMVARLRAKPGQGHRAGPERIVSYSFDHASQRYSGHYVEFIEGAGHYRTIPFRYVWPSELDLMARLAGLRLRDRWADWNRRPFTNDSRSHVSVWQKPGEPDLTSEPHTRSSATSDYLIITHCAGPQPCRMRDDHGRAGRARIDSCSHPVRDMSARRRNYTARGSGFRTRGLT